MVWLSGPDAYDFGYGLKKEYWRRGIITEASFAVVEKIRDSGIPYITATHDRNNPRSGEVMKKLGMIYQYTYVEQWQPKNIPVHFRMYQLNFHENAKPYMKYWNMYSEHYLESLV